MAKKSPIKGMKPEQHKRIMKRIAKKHAIRKEISITGKSGGKQRRKN